MVYYTQVGIVRENHCQIGGNTWKTSYHKVCAQRMMRTPPICVSTYEYDEHSPCSFSEVEVIGDLPQRPVI